MVHAQATSPVSPERDRISTGAFDRIVVGFDERPASRDALVFAAELSKWSGAVLIVASVRPYWPDLLGPARYEAAVAEDEGWLRREVGQIVPSEGARTRVIDGNLEAEGLKHFAAREGADLIVVGSTHRGAAGRVLLGSFGERILNNAPCAVGVAPLGLAEAGLELRRIAVGYDGSTQAATALGLGISLAKGAGAELLVLAAVDLDLDVTGFERESAEAREEARLTAHLERARERAPAGSRVEVELLHGPPSHALVDASRSCDLLVLGSRGHYGSARRLFLGSVAVQVTRRAPCATLIAPAVSSRTA